MSMKAFAFSTLLSARFKLNTVWFYRGALRALQFFASRSFVSDDFAGNFSDNVSNHFSDNLIELEIDRSE